MRLVMALLGAFAVGAAASSQQAEATAFPVQFDFSYCWGSPTCAYPPAMAYFTVQQNGTFTTSDGFSGTWRYNAAIPGIRLTYSGGVPIYQGRLSGGCVTDQPIMANGAQQGTWSGCIH